MITKYKLLFLLFVISICQVKAQFNIYPEISTGLISHLGRQGINSEIGVSFQLFNRFDLSMAYRLAQLDDLGDRNVIIEGLSSFLSFAILKKKNHDIMIGTGIHYGEYMRFRTNNVFEKTYSAYNWNPVKLSYDYKFAFGLKLGLDLILYGDDADGSSYAGLNLGYYLF